LGFRGLGVTSKGSLVLKRLKAFVKGDHRDSDQPVDGDQTTDYERIGLVWRPYLMRLSKPAQKTKSVETDALGFRIARHQGKVYTFPEYRESTGASVLLGNSAAFGVGATCDDNAIANQLSAITGRPWFNLANRASNIMQEVLSLLLLGAPKHRDIVLLSGVNDLLFALNFDEATPFFPTFWGEDVFSGLNDSSDLPRDACNLTEEQRYLLMIEGIDRSLLLLERFGVRDQARILFVLQPLLAWIEKPLHEKEAAVCAKWDAMESGIRATHRPEVIGPWKQRFSTDIRQLCQRHCIHFIDLNDEPQLRSDAHLFVDRIHLTDTGQQAVAHLIAGHLQALRGIGGTSSTS
jgi:lysophospholipase L1-like esterase